jgi:hypothetical protein
MPKYTNKDFYGTVILKDWISALDDRQIKRLTGRCTVVQDVNLVGFKTRGESNWAVRVCGDTEQWTVLGCQIRAVIAHPAIAVQTHDAAHIVR